LCLFKNLTNERRIKITYEARKLLMERLDKNLLDHAATIGSKEGGPEILDVYQLGALAERHYYLKAEHPFTPDEVEALLQFSDPLEVAQACWEDNSHPYSFPICTMLEEINAWERFPLAEPERTALYRSRPESAVRALKAVLKQNLSDFQESLLTMDQKELISKSAEIARMEDAYEFMVQDYSFRRGDAETLLGMENPLKFVAEQWTRDISNRFDLAVQVRKALAEAREMAMPEKTSVREQLRKTSEEVSRQPVQKSSPRTEEPR
jgi:uncharacterized protein (DUF1778 family)